MKEELCTMVTMQQLMPLKALLVLVVHCISFRTVSWYCKVVHMLTTLVILAGNVHHNSLVCMQW